MPPPYERHGMRKHPIYRAWSSMKSRCRDSKHKSYRNYGGRGIEVCERWQTFLNFKEDMFSTWEPGLTLDRIDNDGNYAPGNCRWTTYLEQNKNRRPFGKVPFLGVSKNGTKYGKKYISYLWNGEKNVHLGMFDTPEEASAAYEVAKGELTCAG